MDQTQLIRYRHIDVCLDEYVVLKNVCFDLKAGEFVYLIGKVGSGKSTLLKTIYAEVPLMKDNSMADSEAFVFDYNLLKIKSKHILSLRRELGIVFQDFKLLIDRTVYENLRFVLRATGWSDKQAIDARIAEVLQQVGMSNKGYKMPHELSGGEQQRIVIARALLNSPSLILADEPTGNLDEETARSIVQLLHDISQAGTAVVMTTHNLSFLDAFPGRVLRCEQASLVEAAQTVL